MFGGGCGRDVDRFGSEAIKEAGWELGRGERTGCCWVLWVFDKRRSRSVNMRPASFYIVRRSNKNNPFEYQKSSSLEFVDKRFGIEVFSGLLAMVVLVDWFRLEMGFFARSVKDRGRKLWRRR